jgi:hypothetical protein
MQKNFCWRVAKRVISGGFLLMAFALASGVPLMPAQQPSNAQLPPNTQQPLGAQRSSAQTSPSNEPPPVTTGAVIPDDEVVLSVGAAKITAKQFREILSALPPQFASLYSQMGPKAFAEQYASLLGLSQEAEKRGIDKTDTFRLMYEFERRVVLAQVMANQITSTAASVSDEEVDYYYTTHEAEFEQLKIRGVLIPIATQQTRATVGAPSLPGRSGGLPKPQYNEQNAQRRALQLRSMIMSRIVDMAEAAKTESDHPTAAKGGDFGYVRRTDLPPAISNTVFNMQTSQISAPLRDKNGFFLIRVEGKRLQPLADVRENIRASLSIEKLNNYLMQIRENYPVTYHPSFYNTLEQPKQAPPGATPATPASK